MEIDAEVAILNDSTKKDGWRPVLALPMRFPEQNSVRTGYRADQPLTP
jgi:hypothetical protein